MFKAQAQFFQPVSKILLESGGSPCRQTVRISRLRSARVRIQEENPKKAGSKSYARFERYKAAQTIQGVLDLGGTCGGRLSCGGRLNGTTTTALSIAGGTAGDVFYALSLDHPQSNVVFDTCRANFDDWLRLYRVTDLDYFDDPAADDASGGDDAFSRDDDDYGGGGGGALPRGWTQLFSCDDCGDCANPTRAWLKTGALARDDYLLQIEGWSGHTGDFTLAVECTPSPYDDAPARPWRIATPSVQSNMSMRSTSSSTLATMTPALSKASI